ncbi:unnamed protein product [Cyprideis torosa]|uniref:Uncharacterized protein n=1 Tax=Cyprideis torosa TaxID=163714 RepID=A0A7R8W4F3_9CRUS|nr:unnamed protein product [Cyprideis torosa]CAG0884150.1 unnamed protein product [Cyprideis torosa]
MACSVLVSVEAPQEYSVQEMTYDGEEVLQPPPTLSENLVRLASKIDFAEADDAAEEEEEEVTVKGEKGRKGGGARGRPSLPRLTPAPSLHLIGTDGAGGQQVQYPWENVRSKLRSALNECCVLLDVIKVCKENKYMVLDPVKESPLPDFKPIAQVMAKKRFIKSANQILVAGAERLRIAQVENSRGAMRSPPVATFHMELLKMRQNWKLKKAGNTIIGDLSYRSTGSRFGQSGRFEVTKGVDDETISVMIPPELECVNFIQVSLQTAEKTVLGQAPLLPSNMEPLPPHAPWQQKLEFAQSSIFCMELFSQLAREAVKQRIPGITHMVVVGDTITITIFPGTNLVIALRQASKKNEAEATGTSSTSSAESSAKNELHNHVLEHSLHQLLWEMHHEASYLPLPHPTTSPVGMPKRRRLAGPEGFSLPSLLELCRSETLLEQIVKQAKHWVLRRQTLELIDSMAEEYTDPCITSHWNYHSSSTEDAVRVNLTSLGYESLSRSSYVLIKVETETLKCIAKDGRIVNTSYEPLELREFLESQIAYHHLNAVHHLSKVMNWNLISNSFTAEAKYCTCTLLSPDGLAKVSIRAGPYGVYQVGVEAPQERMKLARPLDPYSIDGKAGGSVDWERVEGRNHVARLETLLATLTC